MIEPLGGYQQTPKRSRKGIYLLIIFVVVLPLVTLVLVGGGIAAFLFLGVRSTDEYACAMKSLLSNSDAKRLLGEPIEPSLFTLGTVSIRNNDRNVTFTTTVTGPKASGELSVVSVRDEFDSDFLISLNMDGKRTTIHTEEYPCGR